LRLFDDALLEMYFPNFTKRLFDDALFLFFSIGLRGAIQSFSFILSHL